MQKVLNSLVFSLLCLTQATALERKAASCSSNDTRAALETATIGDVVLIPAGNCDWTDSLVVSKGVTLRGAGPSATSIRCNGLDFCIEIDLPADVPIQITGLSLGYATNDRGGHSILISGKRDGSFGYSKLRIDHNIFVKGTRAIHAVGWVEGVIDNNTFLNCNIGVGISGDDTKSWARPIEAGTEHSLFIEDNSFIITNDTDREPNEQIYHQQGGRTVTRYNTFDGSAYTNGYSIFFDSHGNWGMPLTAYRGQPIIEIYKNSFRSHSTYDMLHFRGGSMLVWGNTLVNMVTSPNIFSLIEEEAWTSGGPWCPACPVTTTWPAQDQVNNAFFWDNTYNGQPILDVKIRDASEIAFFKKNRDYFMHAPQASGGREVYLGAPGGAMAFEPNSSNAYFPYSPFPYPHPLRNAERPLPPANLKLKP